MRFHYLKALQVWVVEDCADCGCRLTVPRADFRTNRFPIRCHDCSIDSLYS